MESNTVEYVAWKNMLRRCGAPSHPGFDYWGGRGISVCDRWRRSYREFLSDVGRKPSAKHTLGRIDNDGNYEPGNVRWELQRDQVRNSRKARRVTALGRTMLLIEWAEETGVPADRIRLRLNRGWPPEEAVGLVPHYDGRARAKPWKSKMVTHAGRTLSLKNWCRIAGLLPATVASRLRRGWAFEKALHF